MKFAVVALEFLTIEVQDSLGRGVIDFQVFGRFLYFLAFEEYLVEQFISGLETDFLVLPADRGQGVGGLETGETLKRSGGLHGGRCFHSFLLLGLIINLLCTPIYTCDDA